MGDAFSALGISPELVLCLADISWNIGSTIHFLLKEMVYSAMTAVKGRVQGKKSFLLLLVFSSFLFLNASQSSVITIMGRRNNLEEQERESQQ